ncbi:uncharacterized protein LDX57_012790 [Aspergillus melleus]|uniref:uncharacterized protein n=1 Tax=Aspergillus melleus TaxID=138277 RepID=UPI001E8DE575|nr:uncharacterized protein LDX57_012790 [Aspergillus melleus]KAH8435161.1 hypothetical protein LDX57_012790 [Aspergillus melleus]
MTDPDDIAHQAISSYFIGPGAENLDHFKTNIDNILTEVKNARDAYFPESPRFIPEDIRSTEEFVRLTTNFRNAVQKAAHLMGKHSVPFWSPRYEAHMATDCTMVSLLGYFMTMLYNPNNVAIEASPFSTAAEILVGEQLSRNLKFYPLSLSLAIQEGDLHFVAESFEIETCSGTMKQFTKLSTWELLNLKPDTILDIPQMLNDKWGISPTFIEDAMKKYNVQSIGKALLEQRFHIQKPIRYMLSTTRHYSWPKGGAITGIGSENILGIKVDNEARVDLSDLVAKLEQSLENQQAVYAVVAIIGSTEEGAVDRLSEILRIRQQFQRKGLSFLVHADAAWGGYFASMLPRKIMAQTAEEDPFEGVETSSEGFGPDLSLKVDTQEDLLALNKPGAAAMSTWLSNQCIGLGEDGYGALLKEVSFTSNRLAAHWAAMTTSTDSFICVPLNRLPAEISGGDVEAQKKFIRDEILCKSNAEIIASDAEKHTMTLLRALGSDLNINAFAINWRYPDGTINDDIEEANYLMQRVLKRLSISTPNDKPTDIDFYLTSTEFKHEEYGTCAENFMDRLGIDVCKQNLMVLRNVVMSAFPTENDFMRKLIKRFRIIVEEEVEVCRQRNAVGPTEHSFIMQGADEMFLVYQPCFQETKHRRQLILRARLGTEDLNKYLKVKGSSDAVILRSSDQTSLESLLNEVKGNMPAIFKGALFNSAGKRAGQIKVSITRIIKNRSLSSRNRDTKYPNTFMPFYLYGTGTQRHISHMLLKSPNIELSAGNVKLELDAEIDDSELSRGAILCFTHVHEAPMQPFSVRKGRLPRGFFFRSGQKFQVKVWRDLKKAEESGPCLLPDTLKAMGPELAAGTIELRDDIYVDSEGVNKDPFDRVSGDGEDDQWRELFQEIKDQLAP